MKRAMDHLWSRRRSTPPLRRSWFLKAIAAVSRLGERAVPLSGGGDGGRVQPQRRAALRLAQVASPEPRVQRPRGRVVFQHVPVHAPRSQRHAHLRHGEPATLTRLPTESALGTRHSALCTHATQARQQRGGDAPATRVRAHVQVLQVERAPRPAGVGAVAERVADHFAAQLRHQHEEPRWRTLEPIRDQICPLQCKLGRWRELNFKRFQ